MVARRSQFCSPQQQQQRAQGQLFALSQEEALLSSDVVVGTLPVATFPSLVLFYSGATHSSVSSKFVNAHHLEVIDLKSSLVIHTPDGGSLATGLSFLKCPIAFGERVLRGNLVVLDMKDVMSS